MSSEVDAVVVGAGPNGLAAAVELARAGLSVVVFEASDRPGGGATTEELTLPGFQQDVCSSVHPLGAGSPYFATLPLERHGLEWVHAPTPFAHPLGDDAVVLERDVEATARDMGVDEEAWLELFGPFVPKADALMRDVLGPLKLMPRHPFLMGRFGLTALRSATSVMRKKFRGERARAVFAGCAAHSMAPLEWAPTAAFGLILGIAGHAYGWPFARRGSQAITDALVGYLAELGGSIECDRRIESLDELPSSRVVLCDVMPRDLIAIAGDRLPRGYADALRGYRHGPGVFKIDWALDGPIPWLSEKAARAGTLHLGGSWEEIALAERAPWKNTVAPRPFVLMSQPSMWDPTRAPAGQHVAWAYTHVPNGSTLDMSAVLEAEVERHAPGFKRRIIARHTMDAQQVELHDRSFVGGDIAGGAMSLRQLFFRPTMSRNPYRTPAKGLYICSSATPPGGAVHGMCGYHAARSALEELG